MGRCVLCVSLMYSITTLFLYIFSYLDIRIHFVLSRLMYSVIPGYINVISCLMFYALLKLMYVIVVAIVLCFCVYIAYDIGCVYVQFLLFKFLTILELLGCLA